jgi:DNA-binding LacI/PurR family transcriptional regulator
VNQYIHAVGDFVAVEDHISVFIPSPLIGENIPFLSNIRIPLEEISRDCLVLLDKAIRNPESGQMNIVHKPILILRESTGA